MKLSLACTQKREMKRQHKAKKRVEGVRQDWERPHRGYAQLNVEKQEGPKKL